MTSLVIFNDFYPVMYRHEFKRERERRIIRFGRSLWSANQLPAQEVRKNQDIVVSVIIINL